MKNISYIEGPCIRCGSKRKISKTWKEKIPLLSGKFTIVECSQIVCTNKKCQFAFDENLEKETQKRAVLRAQKEERDKERKANSLKNASKSRKNKSRI